MFTHEHHNLQGGKRVKMKTQLRVIKEDGSIEEYLHTKVLGAISNALGSVGREDIFVAEQLAEVVTYFLYHSHERKEVASSEILSIIKVVLSATNYEDAAISLSEHNLGRRLKRSRVEVVPIEVNELIDAQRISGPEQYDSKARWDKSKIVMNLVTRHGLNQQTARTVASMVEEKIFNMGMTVVPVSLLRQLVLGDTAVVLDAERQLQTI